MVWAFRMIQRPNGVAVHQVYCPEGGENPSSCSATPFVVEAADVDDLQFLLERILKDAMQNPILDGRSLGLFDSEQQSVEDGTFNNDCIEERKVRKVH